MRVALASSSQISADAGAEIVRAGGNAVDAALAAALVSAISEPGVCALGAGAYLSIWAPNGEPLTIDANVAIPGLGLEEERRGLGGRKIYMEYGGGVETIVGHGSVATPGALAGCAHASETYGRLPWRELFGPCIHWAREGFPLSLASFNYLRYAHDLVFGWNTQSFSALHDEQGTVLPPGAPVVVAGLADSLSLIAEEGVDTFYRGDLARAIVADISAHEGALTLADLDRYRPVARPCLSTRLGPWEIATNPAPAIGGATLAAMLTLLDSEHAPMPQPAEVARMADIQHRVLAFRAKELAEKVDCHEEIEQLMALARAGHLDAMTAPSTVHVSAIDSDGLACAITMSAGYGSGVMPPGTGIWLNNCLGELELNRRGLAVEPPGAHLPSNMAPCVAQSKSGRIMAIGSPGADRITSAILQTLINLVHRRQSLTAAIEAPRLHVENSADGWRAACEPGLPVAEVALPVKIFPEASMYFGGVGAAVLHADGSLEAAADPRRTGGIASARTE